MVRGMPREDETIATCEGKIPAVTEFKGSFRAELVLLVVCFMWCEGRILQGWSGLEEMLKNLTALRRLSTLFCLQQGQTMQGK